MARFIADRIPEHIAWCSQIRAVPFKRFTGNELSCRDKPEMDAVLAPSEAASLLIDDLNLLPNQLGDVQLRGKGGKTRRCPLWGATVDALFTLVRNRRKMLKLIEAMEAFAEPVEVVLMTRSMSRDPSDDMILDVVINGRAEALVTSNKKHFAAAGHATIPCF